MVAVIILAAVGVLTPAHRGSIGTAAVIIVVLLGFIAGMSSARL